MQRNLESPDLMDAKYNSMRVSPAGGSSRILYHMPCKVCHDHSSGKHYGIYACDGCAGFFKRSIRRSREYVCKSSKPGKCVMDKTHRNQCRSCRLQRCFAAGMNKDSVQHERGPRNSTLRRQYALYKDAVLGAAADMPPLPHELLMNSALAGFPPMPAMPLPGSVFSAFPGLTSQAVLDLSMPRVPHHHAHPSFFAPSSAAFMNVNPVRNSLPTPPTQVAEHVRETAAEHILKNVNWIRTVRVFTELPMPDQLQLLEESWKELFILAIAQHCVSINFAQLLVVYESENSSRDIINSITREVHHFQDVLNQFNHLNVDAHEYECLRIHTLFRKPSSNSSSMDDLANTSLCTGSGSPNSSTSAETRWVDSSKISAMHEEARNALHAYTSRTYPNQPLRFQTLLGILPLMNRVSSFAIEELFFRKTIGGVTIVRLISDMYSQHKI